MTSTTTGRQPDSAAQVLIDAQVDLVRTALLAAHSRSLHVGALEILTNSRILAVHLYQDSDRQHGATPEQGEAWIAAMGGAGDGDTSHGGDGHPRPFTVVHGHRPAGGQSWRVEAFVAQAPAATEPAEQVAAEVTR